ncbi:hypothetical protein T07_4864 [Trichinella nelsoni]|uniref:Uncharacterized protein n=1 Tax=Trichinella nelsoni TaxID=6336 RepID=A0A0V0S9S9_9BILA|nr:hypothetical protein T07_4864 [Trichinella nelsoni]
MGGRESFKIEETARNSTRLLGKLCTKLKERQADVVKNRPAGRFQLTMSCTAAS